MKRDSLDLWIEDKRLPQNKGKPLILLDPWGDPFLKLFRVEYWDQFVAEYSIYARFWQIGRIGDSAVVECEYYDWYDWPDWHHSHWKKLAEHASGWIGVDQKRANQICHDPKLTHIIGDLTDLHSQEASKKWRDFFSKLTSN